MELSQQQIAEVAKMKQYFPFRIAYGALNPQTGEFFASAATTMLPLNKRIREGWLVWQLS